MVRSNFGLGPSRIVNSNFGFFFPGSGGVWLKSNPHVKCINVNDTKSKTTMQLQNLSLVQILAVGTAVVIDELDEIISAVNISSLTHVDIFLIGQIMQEMQYCVSTHPLEKDDVTKVLSIYNRLLRVNDEIMYNTSLLNSTNVLLGAIDVILAEFATSELAKSAAADGILSFQFDEPMMESFIFDPMLTQFTGIVATEHTSNPTVKFLDKSSAIVDIINTPDLIIASYIPDTLLQHLSNPFVVVSFFLNDILFRSYNPANVNFSSFQNVHPKTGGPIISIVLPGTDGRDLPESLPIFIGPTKQNDKPLDNECGFWGFSPTINGWATDGCALNRTFAKGNVALCECDHLTHYAYLFYGRTPIDLKHYEKLRVITYVACSLSLGGLCAIYLSAILFRKWSSTLSTKYLLHLSTALTLELIMILFVSTEEHSRHWIEAKEFPICIALGAILHYTVLVTWMWMFVIGFMQYMRYVVVFQKFDSDKIFLVSSFLGWGIPMIPVAAVLFINSHSYVSSKADNFSICYPSGVSIYWAVMGPIAVITLANLVIFVLVIKSIATASGGAYGKNESRALMLSKLRLGIFLFFLLGLTWIFAFLSTTDAGVAFTYLFCVTATVQGFVLFFYFIILDPMVREMWLGLFRKKIN